MISSLRLGEPPLRCAVQRVHTFVRLVVSLESYPRAENTPLSYIAASPPTFFRLLYQVAHCHPPSHQLAPPRDLRFLYGKCCITLLLGLQLLVIFLSYMASVAPLCC